MQVTGYKVAKGRVLGGLARTHTHTLCICIYIYMCVCVCTFIYLFIHSCIYWKYLSPIYYYYFICLFIFMLILIFVRVFILYIILCYILSYVHSVAQMQVCKTGNLHCEAKRADKPKHGQQKEAALQGPNLWQIKNPSELFHILGHKGQSWLVSDWTLRLLTWHLCEHLCMYKCIIILYTCCVCAQVCAACQKFPPRSVSWESHCITAHHVRLTPSNWLIKTCTAHTVHHKHAQRDRSHRVGASIHVNAYGSNPRLASLPHSGNRFVGPVTELN